MTRLAVVLMILAAVVIMTDADNVRLKAANQHQAPAPVRQHGGNVKAAAVPARNIKAAASAGRRQNRVAQVLVAGGTAAPGVPTPAPHPVYTAPPAVAGTTSTTKKPCTQALGKACSPGSADQCCISPNGCQKLSGATAYTCGAPLVVTRATPAPVTEAPAPSPPACTVAVGATCTSFPDDTTTGGLSCCLDSTCTDASVAQDGSGPFTCV